MLGLGWTADKVANALLLRFADEVAEEALSKLACVVLAEVKDLVVAVRRVRFCCTLAAARRGWRRAKNMVLMPYVPLFARAVRWSNWR